METFIYRLCPLNSKFYVTRELSRSSSSSYCCYYTEIVLVELLACYSDFFKHVSFNISKATRFLHSFHLYMVIQNSNIFVNIRSFKTKYMTKISFLECVY